jgi:hypothetical protein
MMRFVSFVLLLFLLLVQPGFGMSSVTYQINWDAINIGGDDFASSLNYQLMIRWGVLEMAQAQEHCMRYEQGIAPQNQPRSD